MAACRLPALGGLMDRQRRGRELPRMTKRSADAQAREGRILSHSGAAVVAGLAVEDSPIGV